MNLFDQKLKETGNYPLTAERISVLLVSMGYKCDLRCSHCYVEGAPDRAEEMSRATMDKILGVLERSREISSVDVTGGAPELNSHYTYFVKSAAVLGRKVMVRSNLTVFFVPGMEGIPDFLAEHRVKIFASLPCYTEQGVDSQRGSGTYKKVIASLKRLNALGYGRDGTGLELDIAFNPPKASRAPDRAILENVYREKLSDMHNITFNNLVAINNVPVGRLRRSMTVEDYQAYVKGLRSSFNPDNLHNVLCREQLCISYEGTLHDCGFSQMQGIAVRSTTSHIDDFDYQQLSTREIATNPVCFTCTAGLGLGCERKGGGIRDFHNAGRRLFQPLTNIT